MYVMQLYVLYLFILTWSSNILIRSLRKFVCIYSCTCHVLYCIAQSFDELIIGFIAETLRGKS